jgi:glycosyltransferase involved in cell wall biosynthesis
MAMKKAIVASNVGWATEMITDGENGFLVHPTDHSKFANRIIQLLLDTDQTATFGSAARIRAEEKYDREKVAALSVSYYQQIIDTAAI